MAKVVKRKKTPLKTFLFFEKIQIPRLKEGGTSKRERKVTFEEVGHCIGLLFS